MSILAGDLSSIVVPYAMLPITGMETAKNGTSDLDIAAGSVVDDGAAVVMSLASLITKTEAAWAVGTNQGGLDGSESSAGSYDVSTWYWVWVIRRSDTGVVDVLFSESNSSPTMPTNYDQKALIGAFYSNSSGQIDSFDQDGDYFWWVTTSLDLDTTSPSTTWALTPLTVPPLVGVHALGRGVCRGTSTTPESFGLHRGTGTPPTNVFEAQFFVQVGNGTITANTQQIQDFQLPVDSSGRVNYKANNNTDIRVSIYTTGWLFPRGRS